MGTKKLKDCCTIIAGQSPESKYYNYEGRGLPFFQGKADFGDLYPKTRVFCSQPTKVAEKDDILLSVRAPVGPTNLSPGKVCIGRGLTAIRPSKELLTRYVLQYFRYFEAQLASQGTGTTFKAITQDIVKNLEIPVPSISEQEYIVSRIDELLSQLETGVDTLKKIKAQLAVYRQAVLKEAFDNLDEEKEVTFGSLMSVVRNGYGLKPDDSGEYRILRIGAVRSMKIDLTDYRLNKTEFSYEDIIHENDLLFTRYNGSREYVGVCACVPRLDIEYAFPDKIIKCTPKLDNTYHSKYLQFYVSQGKARDYIRSKIKTTSGQNGIAGSDIKRILVNLPSIDKQQKIVEKIESRLSVCDSIEQSIESSLQQAAAMRQSILKQAFEGRL